MSAKSELFVRLKFLDVAIENTSLIDDGIALSEHNGSANLLRKGLAIIAFNILEDFIKNKAIETLKHISRSGVSFSKLSIKLQETSTLGALRSLAFKARIVKKEEGNWQELIQKEALKIHSTKNHSFELSNFSLVSSSSNISVDEVIDLLKAFSINGAWEKLKNVSDNISGGVTNLKESYKNATERRHSSAHVADYRYEYTWLNEIKREILSIAASLDILLTARCRQVDNDTTKSLEEHNIDNVLKFRFLEKHNLIYKETINIGGRSRKNWDSLDDAIATIKPRLTNNNEFLIILDSSKSLSDWYA